MKSNLLGRYSSYLFLVRTIRCSSHGAESRATRSKVSGNNNSRFYFNDVDFFVSVNSRLRACVFILARAN